MVFTSEQYPFILMAHFRSATPNPDGSWTYSLESCIEQFNEAFPDANIPHDVFVKHKQREFDRFATKKCICKSKSTTLLTQAVVGDIYQRMAASPKKSLRKLSAQAGISRTTFSKDIKKSLHMHPYKVPVIHRLYPIDFETRIDYCNWFNDNINNNDVLYLTFFTDYAWFHLSAYVKSYRRWATENPHTSVEVDLNLIKVGIWVAISRRRIKGPIFFHHTINSERCQVILQQFVEELHDDELERGFFQQDNVSTLTAQRTLTFLREFYEDRIISRGKWPARSPDMTPPDYFFTWED